MANNLYITATESKSGKSAICLGVMELLLRNVDRVGFFRPLININGPGTGIDNDLDLISSYYNLKTPYNEMYANTTIEANEFISLGRQDELIENIFVKYKQIQQHHDFVLCEGTDYLGSTSSFEFDINAEVANNLGCPVLLVANAHNKSVDEALRSIYLSIYSLR
jgi:phosphate acetyltransferase